MHMTNIESIFIHQQKKKKKFIALMRPTVAFMVLVAAFAAMTVSAGTAALSHKDLHLYAGHIFVGEVLKIEHVDVAAKNFPTWTTRHFRATVRVLERVKNTTMVPSAAAVEASLEAVDPDVVHMMYWSATGRTPNFRGDVGVTTLPVIGGRYTFHTQHLSTDPALRRMYHESFPHEEDCAIVAYNALTPNGIQSFPEKA